VDLPAIKGAYLEGNTLIVKTDFISMSFFEEASDAEEDAKNFKLELCYNSEGKEVEII